MTNGYYIKSIKKKEDGNCIIILKHSGSGISIKSKYYQLITSDEALIRKAHEIYETNRI